MAGIRRQPGTTTERDRDIARAALRAAAALADQGPETLQLAVIEGLRAGLDRTEVAALSGYLADRVDHVQRTHAAWIHPAAPRADP